MRRMLSFYINYNIVVSCASFALYKVTEFLFNFYDIYLGLFVFCSTLFAYNYMRTISYKPFFLGTNSSVSIKHLPTYLILFFSLLGMVYAISCLEIKFLKLILPALVISLLYPIRFSINKQEYSLRSVPFLKIFIIAFTWAYVTFLAPVLYYDFSINYYMLDFWFQRVLFILAISMPFDIRDFSVDNIKTIPNTIGIFNSKIFAWFCLLLIDLLLIINLINGIISIPIFIAFFLCVEVSSIVIYFSNPNQSFIFYGFIVESLSIIMCLFVLIASFF